MNHELKEKLQNLNNFIIIMSSSHEKITPKFEQL